jgi:DNA-binding NarL/FixJ family response regulator
MADDGLLFREGLALLLEAAGHEVVGWAADGEAFERLLEETAADVAILDIRMPPEPDGGLSTAARLRERRPELGLLLLSQYAGTHYLMRVLEIGTERIGYRLKDQIADVAVLSDTLKRIVEGEVVIEPALARQLVEGSTGAQPAEADRLAAMSERELDVLRLMAEGRANAAIAGALFVSVKSVEKHVASIFTKLGLPPEANAYHRRVLAVLAYLRTRRIESG